jgi:predicted nucleic acid-binding protein
MHKQVVDASAVLAVILGEDMSETVRDTSQGADFIAPGSLPSEVGNALVVNVRKGRLTLEQAQAAMRQYEQIPVRMVATNRTEALGIAHEEGIYAYDAYMITCAERHTAPLLVLDLRLRAVARRRGISVLPERIAGDERYE